MGGLSVADSAPNRITVLVVVVRLLASRSSDSLVRVVPAVSGWLSGWLRGHVRAAAFRAVIRHPGRQMSADLLWQRCWTTRRSDKEATTCSYLRPCH
jgi:hypothetical protein